MLLYKIVSHFSRKTFSNPSYIINPSTTFVYVRIVDACFVLDWSDEELSDPGEYSSDKENESDEGPCKEEEKTETDTFL